jgi:hypothetical protein
VPGAGWNRPAPFGPASRILIATFPSAAPIRFDEKSLGDLCRRRGLNPHAPFGTQDFKGTASIENTPKTAIPLDELLLYFGWRWLESDRLLNVIGHN